MSDAALRTKIRKFRFQDALNTQFRTGFTALGSLQYHKNGISSAYICLRGTTEGWEELKQQLKPLNTHFQTGFSTLGSV